MAFRCRLIHTDLVSSELIKCASNTFLATKVRFINVMADICEKNRRQYRGRGTGMGSDKHIGRTTDVNYKGKTVTRRPSDASASGDFANQFRTEGTRAERPRSSRLPGSATRTRPRSSVS
jgi:hypothetical protein